MKKIILLFVIIILLVIIVINCSKENWLNENQSDNTFTTEQVMEFNDALEKISFAVSKSLENKEFRLLLKDEAMKQFDYDFDVLYRTIADKNLPDSKLTVKELLANNLSTQIENDDAKIEKLDNLTNLIPYLQFAVPWTCKNWDIQSYIPDVGYIDLFNTNAKEINGFNNKGNQIKIAGSDAFIKPIVVVGPSERIDDMGRLKVDKYGIVLPMEERISISEAMSRTLLKSTDSDEEEISLIEIVNTIDNIYNNEGLISNDLSIDNNNEGEDILISSVINILKATSGCSYTAYPTQVKGVQSVKSQEPFEIEIEWSEATNAESYIIKRRKENESDYTSIASVSRTQTYYIDRSFAVNDVGKTIKYRIQANNCKGSGAVSYTEVNSPSQRRNNGIEYLRKIKILSSYLQDIEPGTSGYIDLDIYLIQSTGPRAGQKTQLESRKKIDKDDIKDKWWSFSRYLFPWNTNLYGTYYTLCFIENDNCCLSGSTSMKVNAKWEPDSAFHGISGGAASSTEVKIDHQSNDKEIGYVDIHFSSPISVNYPMTPIGGGSQKFFIFTGHLDPYNKCPYGGGFDGANCHIGFPPSGTKAFIWDDGLYYTLPSNGLCTYPGAWREGNACKIALLPRNVHTFIYNNGWYYVAGY